MTGVTPEPAADPVRPGPAVQEIDLTPASGASPTVRSFGAPGTARTGTTAVPQRATQPFSLLGAVWDDPRAVLRGTVEVRTRAVAGGTWTGWQTLESDGRSPADPASADGGGRGRTDPLWVGTSDAVQARVSAADGRSTSLPEGLHLILINPDAPADRTAEPQARAAAEPQARVAAEPQAPVAVPARPVPRMVTRAGWDANESIVEDAPDYTPDVQVMFVHHTAGTNDYSCQDSARIVRGIQGYHVRGNGWNDIGYNFLVDRCGTLFEGRGGGVQRAVLGAHTMGFNAHSSAIAVLGNYGARTVPAVVRTAIAQVTAYKLGAYGNLATGRTTLRSGGNDRHPSGTLVSFDRVSGHRDAGPTACPGDALYGQIGGIRALAGAGPANLRLAGMTGAAAAGAEFFTRGQVSPLWDTDTPSALLNRFDVFVDGVRVASAPNSHRRVSLQLAPGRHTLLVRAIHLSGRTASFTRTVVVDTTAPQFTTAPSVVLRTGSLNGSVPVRVGWTASDAGGLRSVAMTQPAAVNLGVTANGWNGTARPGVANTWSLRAADRAGNATAASVTRTPVVVSELSATRTGPWTGLRNSAYLSGHALRSTARGASMTWTFTGRSASLAASRTTVSGLVTVYVDGRAAGTLDLRAATVQNRQAVWARNWGASGTHTVRVVVAGTTGRPGAVLDGLVVLR